MTNTELKKMIKNAYEVEPSCNKKDFIKLYQKRELHLWDILKQQAGNIGLINVIAGLVVMFVFWQLMLQGRSDDVLLFARISAVVPIIAVVAISGMGRSERYGMDELEMASRFSLRTVLAARLIVIGIVDVLVFIGILLAFGMLTDIGIRQAILVISVPYLITSYGCLLITRRMHNKKDIAVCIGFACMVCLMCASTDNDTPWKYLYLGNTVSYLLCAAMCVMIGLEINKLLKGENYKWNLC